MTPGKTPNVSVIIPCLNEEDYISTCLQSILDNDYPKRELEILVVDGMSTDGTREILDAYSNKYEFIRVIGNPEKITPKALNIGIEEASGEVIIRMDAHSIYHKHYILKNVKQLKSHEKVWNVGGIRKTEPRHDTLIGKALKSILTSKFGLGMVPYRTGTKKVKEVDTVFGGCFPSDIFKKIGKFDERLIRGQDREFNFRIRENSGRILLDPDITCTYFVRSKLSDFLPWIYESGKVPFQISFIKSKRIFSFRNLIPLLFTLSLIVPGIVYPFLSSVLWGLIGLLIVYSFINISASILESIREHDPLLALVLPFIYFLTHISYGLGSLWSISKHISKYFLGFFKNEL